MRQEALILAKQVLGTFGNVDSILEASACVQLTGSPPRFAKLIAFVKQQDHGALIHAAIYMFLNSIDHPEHECLLHASRSSNITLVLIEDIKGSVPVVPYFATAQYSPRDCRYNQFIIDVRLIWRIGGNLRINTRVNEVKRPCPNYNPHFPEHQCTGKISRPEKIGGLVTVWRLWLQI